MPEMNGKALSEFIRSNPKTSQIPIIMDARESTSNLYMAIFIKRMLTLYVINHLK